MNSSGQASSSFGQEEAIRWEMMDEAQAQQSCAVVPFGESGIDDAQHPSLDGMLRAWFGRIRDQHPDQMGSPALLEAGIDVARAEILQQAASCKDPCMATPLLPDRWLILARSDVVEQVGVQAIVRSAHQNAMQHACNHGQPFNKDTLKRYEEQERQREQQQDLH